MKPVIATLFAFALTPGRGCPNRITPSRWIIDEDGGITWKVKPHDVHDDNVEMSGKKVSVIVTYGVDEAGNFSTRKLVGVPDVPHRALSPTYAFAHFAQFLPPTLHLASC